MPLSESRRRLHLANDERGAARKHERERELCDHKRVADAPVPAPGGCAARFFRHDSGVDARRGHRRRDAEKQRCRPADQQQKREHRPVECDFVDSRNSLGAERDEQVAGPSRDENAGETSREREQQALDHELPRETRTRRAKRRPRGKLLIRLLVSASSRFATFAHAAISTAPPLQRAARANGASDPAPRRHMAPPARVRFSAHAAPAIDAALRQRRSRAPPASAVAPGFNRATSALKRPRNGRYSAIHTSTRASVIALRSTDAAP